MRAIERFFEDEASRLHAAIVATGYSRYPVAQHDRDALFLRFRDRLDAGVAAEVRSS